MPAWKSLLLSLYYHGTYPGRAWRNARWAREGRAPVIVLFGHRIADTCPNDWTASTRLFARQVDWLRRRFPLVSLAEAQQRVACGRNDRPCVSITFDDGYADNCRFALPLLLKSGIPFTYFVATDFIFHWKPFPHDVARRQPLRPNSPAEIRELASAGVEIGAHTRSHADLGRIADPDALYEELIGSREALQELTGRPVRYFAFPYGQHDNLNPAAFELARATGFEAVCSAYGGFNFPGDDPFHLQRIHLDNDMIRLKNWVTVDRRKLRLTRRYEYQSSAQLETAGVGVP